MHELRNPPPGGDHLPLTTPGGGAEEKLLTGVSLPPADFMRRVCDWCVALTGMRNVLLSGWAVTYLTLVRIKMVTKVTTQFGLAICSIIAFA